MDASYFLRGLIQRGLPEHIAQGFLMNAQNESGLNPGINEAKPLVPGSRGGFGLLQWTGLRRRQLEAFAGQRGTAVSDPDMQMDFLMSELQGPEKSAWNRIQQATTPGEAGAAIVNAFLRPAEQHRARRERDYLGGGLLNVAASTKSPETPMNGILGMMAQPKDERTFGQRFRDGMRDGSTWDAIAMGLNTMRGAEADHGLASMVQNRMQGRKDERRINQTAQWLRAQGREDLAAAIEAGLMEGGAAMQTMMQGQQQAQEKNQTIEWLRSIGRDDLAEAAASGALPIGEAFNAANGQDQKTPSEIEALRWRAEQAGLTPGTPEYQQFILNGGRPGDDGGPAAFQALHMQAEAAGFPAGSPEYQQFMATRGAGLAAEAKAIGSAAGASAASAEGDYQTAQNALDLIESIRNDPNRRSGTGKSSIFNAIPGTGGSDFQQKVEQAKGGAFLTAVQTMKGLGALSNNEGTAATQAITRMNTASTEEGFMEALADYEKIVRQGMARATRNGGGPQQAQPAEAPPTQAAPQRRRYNAQTGGFE
ncbi:phage tail tip lysozyme [Paracoccus sp. DMF-8]|uniref:phage tail tip lysozyme n=1 Tax=Paracoccus sp. DMF-8 TaxID=3019445 RepID=UPI0023E3B309|nr:phage tail tip lysozyme [Paracoccus sp. DMF-8]MDF3607555.1 phage tail tip lysozyme [Paracoccus sp. DMF-8]